MFNRAQLALLSHSLSPSAEKPYDKHNATCPVLLIAWARENEWMNECNA